MPLRMSAREGKSRLNLSCLFVVLMLGLIGWGSSFSASLAQGPIAVIVPQGDPRFPLVSAAVKELAAELQLEIFVEPLIAPQFEVQSLENLISRGITSLVIYPSDPDTVASFLQSSAAADTPVAMVTIGEPIDGAQNFAPSDDGAVLLGEWARQQLQGRVATVLPLEAPAADFATQFSQSYGASNVCAGPTGASPEAIQSALESCQNPDIVITRTPLGAAEAMEQIEGDRSSWPLFISIGSGCLSFDGAAVRVDAAAVPRDDLLVRGAINLLLNGSATVPSSLDVAAVVTDNDAVTTENIQVIRPSDLGDVCPLEIPSACCTKGNKSCCPRQ